MLSDQFSIAILTNLFSLGEDHLGWSPAFQDYKLILEQLKSQDEMSIYTAVMSL